MKPWASADDRNCQPIRALIFTDSPDPPSWFALTVSSLRLSSPDLRPALAFVALPIFLLTANLNFLIPFLLSFSPSFLLSEFTYTPLLSFPFSAWHSSVVKMMPLRPSKSAMRAFHYHRYMASGRRSFTSSCVAASNSPHRFSAQKRGQSTTATATASWVYGKKEKNIASFYWHRGQLVRDAAARPVPSPAFNQERQRNTVSPLQNRSIPELDDSYVEWHKVSYSYTRALIDTRNWIGWSDWVVVRFSMRWCCVLVSSMSVSHFPQFGIFVEEGQNTNWDSSRLSRWCNSARFRCDL